MICTVFFAASIRLELLFFKEIRWIYTVIMMNVVVIFDEYNLESLKVASLVFQSKDDRFLDYDKSLKGASRFPESTFISFEKGGHLLKGNEEIIKDTVMSFVNQNS